MTIKKSVRLFQILLIVTLSVLFSGTGLATTIYVDAVKTTAISADMSSMDVTVDWIYDGSDNNETYDWGVSGVSGDWGSLMIGDGDTFFIPWTLAEKSDYTIKSITLTGNDVLFDIYAWEYSTIGSEYGFFGSGDIDWVGRNKPSGDTFSGTAVDQNNLPLFSWTASNPVALTGADAPEYDLWNTLKFDFTNANIGADGLTWDLDTDLAVPEPTTLLLFGLGLLGIGAIGRRRV